MILTPTEEKVKSLLESYDKPMDLIRFIRWNRDIQSNLQDADYGDALGFIDTHSDYDIEAILSQTDCHDDLCGNCDPLYKVRGMDEGLFWDMLGGDDCPHADVMQELFNAFCEQQDIQERLAAAKAKIAQAKERLRKMGK